MLSALLKSAGLILLRSTTIEKECGQSGLSKFQAMQPYVTGLIWHRMERPSKALLVLTFQLVDFSLRVTPEGRSQFC